MSTINSNSLKATSYSYGKDYQLEQVDKHKNRKINHWVRRIGIAHELIDKYVLPRIKNKSNEQIVTLDVGCSIGTMAIEMANRGFKAYGVDFDQSALDIALNLSKEENANVIFFNGDIAEWQPEINEEIDIAICFDIFEHLHDDELGGLLQSVRRKLQKNGALIFYTYPQQYDYIFFGRPILHLPLILFKYFSHSTFNKFTKAWSALLDFFYILVTGQTYKERIKKYSHCNPTTIERLKDTLERSGYTVPFINAETIYPYQANIVKRFSRQPITFRSIFGVAYPKSV